MDKPLVSVVMATYNGARFLSMMLESIVAQTYHNLEIIIFDDASIDETRDILQRFARSDSRIKVFHSETNQGAVKTFEMALHLASGEFIALADQDDIFRNDKIELLVERMRQSPGVDLVLSDLSLIDNSGAVITESMWRHQRLHVAEGKPFEQLLYANFATGCAMLIRRRLLDAALPFPENCIMHDWWLSVLSARTGGGGIALVPQPLTSYRQHSSNVIGAHSGALIASIRRVSVLANRSAWYAKNRMRLEAYLSDRALLWSEDDRLAIRRMMDVFTCMSRDETNSFRTRMRSIGMRVHYAQHCGWVHLLGIVVFTIFPRFADWLRRIA